jgi:hypothetical protein
VTGDADALAAEYVLGTLDFDERSAAESLRTQDAEFAAKVKVWERRLGELHLMVEPVDPDPDIWQRIKAKLPALPRPQPAIPISELKPEPAPDRVPENQAQLTPPEPTPVIPQPGEPNSDMAFLHFDASQQPEMEPPQIEATEPEAKAEPVTVTAPGLPTTAEAPSAAPDVLAPSSEQAAPNQLSVVLPGSDIFDAKAAAALADALAAPEPQPSTGLAAPLTPQIGPEEKLRISRQHLARWRTAAVLMGLVMLGAITLISLWRYWPERVPTELRPLQLMRLVGIAVDSSVLRRRPAPPESHFDE